MASYGYFFPIDDHILTVKNDNTYYRFQTPCFWPSKCGEPENTEYAVYLCKRTMQNKQRLELADYEAENLARLQKMFSRKWEFIFMQAEAQAKVDKKRDKLERKVLDSQERAFWDVHRPAPGCVNTTEIDIKKACKVNNPFTVIKPNYNVPGGRISPSVSETDVRNPSDNIRSDVSTPGSFLPFTDIHKLRTMLEKRRVKVSKVAESYLSYYQQYAEFDPFMTQPDPSNPWISDNTDFWEVESSMRDIPQRRVRRWAFSIHELLNDPAGREHFERFLEKEFSSENLKFWMACQRLKYIAEKDVRQTVQEIYDEFLSPTARDPVNVDCHVAESVRQNVETSCDRCCFDVAVEHIFHLMKSDSYSRYLRSEMYKEFLSGTKKKVPLE
ncbi:hypothetical protein NP493_269g00000 [Ridgeia piscesae]|uniref:RGS domain-containing protein n=1 Tax=Ridgeia piscesae TaxID=27915 RepID=A0AAD9NXP5_RIDPI|nr:hypothetical protein NP493_269g00000 [Ridgeia piscesae]